MRMDDFAYAYTSPTTSWLSWMSGRFRRWLPGSEQKLFVVMPTVKALARQIIETRNRQKTVGPSDHLYTLSEFREKYGKIGESELTDGDLWLLIRYMSAEFGIAVADHVQGYGASYVVCCQNLLAIRSTKLVTVFLLLFCRPSSFQKRASWRHAVHISHSKIKRS